MILTPVGAKSSTLRVIRARPWRSAAAAIRPSMANTVRPLERAAAVISPQIRLVSLSMGRVRSF